MTPVETIKDIRIELDGISSLIKNLPDSEFTSKALTASQLSKMWLGKTLKELGNKNPYPESKNPESTRIEPTADKAEYGHVEDCFKDQSFNDIQKVKWIRAELERIENKIFELKSLSPVTYRFNIYSTNSFNQCVEAGMWLGMELGRIREEGK